MRQPALDFLTTLADVLCFLSRPTLANAIYGSRYWGTPGVTGRDLVELGKRGYLEMGGRGRNRKDRVLRLTAKGRLLALGGRDPEECWDRPWDGKWRMVLFDIPETDRKLRDTLRRHLLARHFGYLQDSVWISPDPMHIERRLFQGTDVNADHLLTLEAVPGTGEGNADIVRGAWNFGAINAAYAKHLDLLGTCPPPDSWDSQSATLHHWLAEEREAWRTTISRDPLLPRTLCPPNYLGHQAWSSRKKHLANLAHHLAPRIP